VIGLDYGTKKIGVAVGQNITRTAMGIGLIHVRQQGPEWEILDSLIKRWKPGALVIGMPFNMDGSENDMTHAVSHFIKTLEDRYALPCHTIDERLSTRAAREISRDNAELIGKKYNDKTKVDALAAQLMLESWLAN
jgi:putative Holliday junction resolvase